MIKKTIFILLLSLSFTVQAEYRAYQYLVTNKIQTASDQPNSKLITTTLSPRSYLSYNGGKQLIKIELVRTWICPGDTSNFKNICPSPYSQITLEDIL